MLKYIEFAIEFSSYIFCIQYNNDTKKKTKMPFVSVNEKPNSQNMQLEMKIMEKWNWYIDWKLLQSLFRLVFTWKFVALYINSKKPGSVWLLESSFILSDAFEFVCVIFSFYFLCVSVVALKNNWIGHLGDETFHVHTRIGHKTSPTQFSDVEICSFVHICCSM